MNANLQKGIQIATVAGSAIIGLNAVSALFSISSPKQAIMPVVTIAVAVAAFNYAVKSPAPVKK